MSTAQPLAAPPPGIKPTARRRRRPGWLAGVSVAIAAVAIWAAWRGYGALTAPVALDVPTARVERGTVNFDVEARGQLTGGRSEMLVAPMVGGAPLSIQFLAGAGTLVKAGDVVVRFDTSTQQYNLTQAREALAQAQQQLAQAGATAAAQTEDDRYQTLKAQYDVKRAQLQVRRNPTLDAVDAQKNDLTLSAAQAHVHQLQADIDSRAASNAANVATQQAAVAKARADEATAEHNISLMTLRATQGGYVALQGNRPNVLYAGMPIPPFQVGDTARPGLAVAQIPDTSTWAVDIEVSEIDAGHLAIGQPVRIEFVALPGRAYAGQLQTIGAASGYGFERQVRCTVSLTQPSPELRPGMSANVRIPTETMANALWVPSEAVFSAGGHDFVYLRSGRAFLRHDITVARRGESRIVVTGLNAGDTIALANPELAAATAARKAAGGGAAAALPGGTK